MYFFSSGRTSFQPAFLQVPHSAHLPSYPEPVYRSQIPKLFPPGSAVLPVLFSLRTFRSDSFSLLASALLCFFGSDFCFGSPAFLFLLSLTSASICSSNLIRRHSQPWPWTYQVSSHIRPSHSACTCYPVHQ